MSFFLNTYSFGPPAACDPYWDYTPLLLHMDGTNGSTAAPTNSSASGILIARDGGNLSSTQARFGTTSYWFDGSGTNSAGTRIISTPDLQMVFGAGDFTIEFSMFVVSAPAVSAILADGRAALTQGAYPTLYLSPSMTLGYYVSSADRITSGSALSLSTWYHVAIVRSAGVTKLYVNGTQYGSSWTDSTNYIADGLVFGASSYHTSPNTQYGLYGYMDEVRVTRGIARYTATFTPPTEAFAATQCAYDPLWSYVVALYHFDGANNSTTFTNSKSGGVTATAHGGTVVSTGQNKFGGSAAYFDGVNDNLELGNLTLASVADVGLTGATDFCVEGWFYIDGTTYAYYPYILGAPGSGVGSDAGQRGGIALAVTGNTGIHIIAGNLSADSWAGYLHRKATVSMATGWHHIAWVSRGNSPAIYLDGVAQTLGFGNGSSSVTSFSVCKCHSTRMTQVQSYGVYNGALDTSNADAAYYYKGYIDDLRITKGHARYAGDFTPPTIAFYDTGA